VRTSTKGSPSQPLSRTSERGGEGDCVKEGGGGEGERVRERHWGCYYATVFDIEVDPQRRRFGCRESDFALLWTSLPITHEP
jgi:hypothetical protein